ncbi:MAG: carboxypeptidase-like regulatory domain-containing protein [Planctomycetaceae bacterium]|nr:carboxypeptidase-like regulatory domain-containing protein [Planctomycetaceae bacterium]
MMKRFAFWFCTAFLLFSGCTKSNIIPTEDVTGTVTLDGAPLEGASVAFSPKSEGQGTPASAVTDSKGFYVLQTPLGKAQAGTSQGEYTVLVRKYEQKKTGQKIKNDDGSEIELTQPNNTLPAVYGDPSKTPLSASVKQGKNSYNFELKTK